MVSIHYREERQGREAVVRMIGYGEEVDRFVVDHGHRNGPEVHSLSSTGIITITNERTGKLITRLIARERQIRRYYKAGKAPEYLIKIAREHEEKEYYKCS